MSIYSKERTKVTIGTVLISLGIIASFWLLLFVTDYIMFRNNKPTVFTNSHVEQTENGKITYEDGAFYYVVTNEKEQKTLYLFNNKID